MKLAVTRSGLAAMAFATLFATPAVAGELVGMIVARNGHQMVVRGHGVDTPVLLTPATKVRAITGALGAQREKHPQSDLINGLAVTVETVEHGDIDRCRRRGERDQRRCQHGPLQAAPSLRAVLQARY